MIEWTIEQVQDLLQHPQRVLREEPCRSAILAHGGLAGMYAWLRTLPLSPDDQRLLEALLDQPGAAVATYANRLGMHVTTYHRHMRRLVAALISFLNQPAAPEPAAPARLQSLPAVPTSFIGRAEEAAALAGLIREGCRLVTVTGAGGAGKTRLSIHVAGQLAPQFEHGAVFVALASLAEPQALPGAILSALGGKEAVGQSVEASLIELLRPRHLLLVLDNFEHVSDAAPLVGSLLAAAPRLTVLVTSRSVLRIYGEQTFALPPLPTPPTATPPLADLARYEAVRLFVARASAADRAFALRDANAGPIAAICRRLDGLPLAIELAAARVRTMPPEQLLGRLDDRLGLLTGGARDLPLRQQTLRDLMDWSYQLLSPAEQRAFTRLAVWTGGWTADAAAATLEAATGDPAILDTLGALLDNSLIVRDPAHADRWTMLHVVREYALSRLAERGELDLAQRLQAEWLDHLADTAALHLRGADQERWLERLETEHDNLRAALQWALETASSTLALRLSGSLWLFWWTHSHLSEGRRWLERALALAAGAPPAAQVRALNGAGAMTWSQGDYAAAAGYFERGLALQQELGDERGAAQTRNNLGLVAIRQADYARATSLFQTNLPIFRSLDDQYSVSATLSNLGMVARYQGDYAQARSLFEESLVLRRTLANRWAIAASLTNLGVVALHQGRFAEADGLLEESLGLLAELGEKESIAECLEALAGVRLGQNHPEAAARLCAAAAALRSAIGTALSPPDQAWHDGLLEQIRLVLEPQAFSAAWSSGQHDPLARTIEWALAG